MLSLHPRILFLGGALALLSGCATVVPPPAALPPPLADLQGLNAADQSATVPLCLLAFNDFHGNLRSPGSLPRPGSGQKVPVGGADALAGTIAAGRQGCAHSLVVAAGDLVGASPLLSGLFHDEPTVEVMNRLGLDATSVGNHEFDAGRAELLRKQNGGCSSDVGHSCQGHTVGTPVPFSGARYPILAANVFDTATGQPLLAPYVVRDIDGIRVALVGVTLTATARSVAPAGIAGLEFRDEAATVNALVPELEAQGVHSIVLLIHQGGQPGDAAQRADDPYNSCADELQDDRVSPIRAIVRQLDDHVDLVISGHSHTAYVCQLPNRVGRAITVTQALNYGRVLTHINAELVRADGRLTVHDAHNRLVERTTSDPAVVELIGRYEALAAPLALAPIGVIAGPVDGLPSAAGELRTGDLLADAALDATRGSDQGGAELALVNQGASHGAQWTEGPFPRTLTYADGFDLQPYGNSLEVLELTVGTLRAALEQAFPGCQGQTRARIPQLSRGVHLVWSASAPECAHVRELSLARPDGNIEVLVHDGQVLNPARTLRVTVNSFLAGGGDGLSLLAQSLPVVSGGQDLDALRHYLGRFPTAAQALDPSDAALGRPRLERLP